jgi:hypothetical protein
MNELAREIFVAVGAILAIGALAFLLAWLGSLVPKEPQRISVAVHLDQPIQVQLVPAR